MRHLRQATESRKPLSVASDNYFEQQTGLVTVQYPHEQLPIPDNGRYRLHNEIDDCIVCDKCAKVCPVDCITIDAIKATEEVGRASDGSPIRLYAATFDIDMAKCCYCGLCTVVCPTECLTMEKKFDYSEFDLGKLTYGFANLTADQAEEKRQLYEQFVVEKAAQKAQVATKPAAPVADAEPPLPPTPPNRPIFRPTPKAKTDTTQVNEVPHLDTDREAAEASPAIVTSGTDPVRQEEHTVQPTGSEESIPKPTPTKPAFRPTMKPPVAKTSAVQPETGIEPIAEAKEQPTLEQAAQETPIQEILQPKPAGFRPTMKPKTTSALPTTELAPEPIPAEAPKSKPAGFRPTMKPKVTPAESTIEVPITPVESNSEEPKVEVSEEAKPKPKAPFRPTMKPKNP